MKNQRNKTKRKLKGGVDLTIEFTTENLIEIWERSTVEVLKLYYEIDHQYDIMKNLETIFQQRSIDLNNACEIIKNPITESAPVTESAIPAEENDVPETPTVHETPTVPVIKNDLGIPKSNYYYKYNTASYIQEFCIDKENHLKYEKKRARSLLYENISNKNNRLLVINTNGLIDIIKKKKKNNELYELTDAEKTLVYQHNRIPVNSTILDTVKFDKIKEDVSIKKKELLKGNYLKVKVWILGYTQHIKNASAYIRSIPASTSKSEGGKRSRKSKQSRKRIRKSRKSNK
jgi:hypothetical protein